MCKPAQGFNLPAHKLRLIAHAFLTFFVHPLAGLLVLDFLAALLAQSLRVVPFLGEHHRSMLIAFGNSAGDMPKHPHNPAQYRERADDHEKQQGEHSNLNHSEFTPNFLLIH
jgi:hypothetical protein